MAQLLSDAPQYACGLAETIHNPFPSSESSLLGRSLMWSSCVVCYYRNLTLVTIDYHKMQRQTRLCLERKSLEGEGAQGNGQDNRRKERGASESTKINFN